MDKDTSTQKIMHLQVRPSSNKSSLPAQIEVGLSSSQFEVVSVYLEGSSDSTAKPEAAGRAIYLGLTNRSLKGLRLKALYKLYKICREEKFDTIIAHRYKPISLILTINLLLKVSRCIGVQHGIGDFDRLSRRLEARLLMRKNWKIVGVSKAVKNYLLGLGKPFSVQNTTHIDNAINISDIESILLPKDEARAKLDLNSNAFIFGTVGRLVPVKGHKELIRAFSELAADYPQAEVVIIGEGRSRPELEQLISALGLGPRIHLLGSRENASKYIRAFDVFVMPSYSEGLPLALLEAMVAGRPLIGTDIDSMKDMILATSGSLFAPGDVLRLADHMKKHLRASASELAEKSLASSAYVNTHHQVEDFQRKYRELVTESL